MLFRSGRVHLSGHFFVYPFRVLRKDQLRGHSLSLRPASGKVAFSFGLPLDSLRKHQTIGQAPQATENRPGYLLQRYDRQSLLLSDLIIILSLLFVNSCAMLSVVLPVTVGGQPPSSGVASAPPLFREGVCEWLHTPTLSRSAF